MAETALATTLSHEISLIRFSRKLGKDAQPHIDAIMKALREELLSTDKITTKKRKDELITLVNEIVGVEIGDWTEQLESELTELAKEEARFHQAALTNLIGQRVARPTLESVIKTAFNTEMVLNNQAYTVDERIKSYSVNSSDRIKRIITGGWRDGLTTYEMAQQITGKQNSSVSSQMRNAAYGLSKDITSHISSTAKTMVGMENQDVVIGEKHISVLDSRVSPICQRLGSLDGGGKEYLYAEDGFNFARPPLHFNCLFEESLITSGYGVSSVSKRLFNGTKVTITSASGNKLAVTPNHPILTRRGWVAAKDLNLSDELVIQTRFKGVADVDWNNDDAKTSIKNVFESFGSSSKVFTREVPTSTPDFHGDGINNEIAVVRSKGLLLSEAISNVSKEIRDLNFVIGNTGEVALSSDSCLAELLERLNPTPSCGVGGSGESLDLLRGASVHSGLLLFRPISGFDSKHIESSPDNMPSGVESLGDSREANPIIEHLDHGVDFFVTKDSVVPVDFLDSKSSESLIYGGFRDTELISNSFGTYAGGVEFDNLVDITFTKVDSAHVYNLQTIDHCYAANGIVTHNCRSTHRFLLAPEFEELEESKTRPSVVDGTAKRVDSNKSWMQLAKENPSLARESLGEERAKVLDAMSAEEFTKIAYDRLGTPIPLDELVKKSKTAARALGRE